MSGPAVIGVCAAIEPVAWGPWSDVESVMLPRTYSNAIQAAGAVALLLPPDPAAADEPSPWLDRIDALLLAGGTDVDPDTYGAQRSEATTATTPDRDAFEASLARAALDRDMPVLGICRGMEMLNVALGGTLDQDLPATIGSEAHREVAGRFSDHQVRLEPGSLAARAAGADAAQVHSHHHQGVDRLAQPLKATGWSGGNDVVEAIELPGAAYALGVLWHPEEDPESPVISSLVEAVTE